MAARRIFEDVRIADFTWLGVGPITTKFLANMGATVIHVESAARPDLTRVSYPYKDFQAGLNRSAFFTLYNDSKYGLSLNLKLPQAQEVARRLVRDWANVVADAHLPGNMEKWGLDYAALSRDRPDLIHVATALQGKTGPYSGMPGHGMAGVSLGGFSEITGWPDGEPAVPFGAYSDFVTFPHMVSALIAALIYRKRTGKGQYIELSQLECSVQFLSPLVMDYILNGRVAKRAGNTAVNAAPHAVYRCKGEGEKWCAIAVTSDEEWQSLCKVMGSPDWTRDERFTTLKGRKDNEDALNALVEQWTVNYELRELMYLLQSSGVPAGMVSSGQDLVADAQLNHRGTHWILDHPEIGPHIYQPPPYRFSKTPVELTMPAPCMGEHNEYVLKEVLGMTDEEIVDLLIAGALE
ncbi:MAG: CoA transferase [Dehalococcoidia bacterium]|nr:CoA transferase [Dehalococcoidia bacterium]